MRTQDNGRGWIGWTLAFLFAGTTVMGSFSGPIGAYLGYESLKEQRASNADQTKLLEKSAELANLQSEILELKIAAVADQKAMLEALRALANPTDRMSKGIDHLIRLKEQELGRLRDEKNNKGSRIARQYKRSATPDGRAASGFLGFRESLPGDKMLPAERRRILGLQND